MAARKEILSDLSTKISDGNISDAYRTFEQLPVVDQIAVSISPGVGDALAAYEVGEFGRRAKTNIQDQDRLGAAGRYGNEIGRELGFRTGGLDKHYSTSLGAFGKDREYLDRDLGVDYQDWKDKKNWDWKKLGFGAGIYSGLPFEEKVVSQQPASGGK